jgi:hypothetical protein
VMHMVPLKQHMYQHLRSAKEWLTKAEEAFDKKHDVRAELDLMLAQAELQHVKEVNRSRQWRYKYVLFRHGLACTLAMIMAAAVGGMYWWTSKTEFSPPVPMVGQVQMPLKTEVQMAPVMIPKEILPVQPIANSSNVPAAANYANELPKLPETSRPVEKPRQVEKSRQVDQPVIISADEMQKLVRAAGKTLRGQ